nr:unnamed protein product [Callosobruchus analis]
MKKKEKKRRIWQKRWLADRKKYCHIALLQELRENNPDDFKNYLRMDGDAFDKLLNLMRPHLSKQDTAMRQSIPADERLIATLRFLATGRSYEDLKFSTGISAQALGRIIPETCKALYEVLHKDYLKMPSSKEEWKSVAEGFNSRWQIPNCGGAIDGKHIRIFQPANTGAMYYNYKNFYSIVLMAIVNAEYEFLYVDVGKNGRLSDGGILEQTTFFRHLNSERLRLPDNAENHADLNFVFIGDEAFALHDHILKPFPQRDLTHERRIYNYRLSRGRNVVENVFGFIAARFRILHTPINVSVDKVSYFVMAICVLHNFLKKRASAYVGGNAFDSVNATTHEINYNAEWRENGVQLVGLRPVCQGTYSEAKTNRDKYVTYFNEEGAVPWQEDMLVRGRA